MLSCESSLQGREKPAGLIKAQMIDYLTVKLKSEDQLNFI